MRQTSFRESHNYYPDRQAGDKSGKYNAVNAIENKRTRNRKIKRLHDLTLTANIINKLYNI